LRDTALTCQDSFSGSSLSVFDTKDTFEHVEHLILHRPQRVVEELTDESL
jgi:hypothetical protein